MTVHIFVSGFVQGVGYRRFVRHHALKIGLKGWVKNLPDNRVEAIFVGSEDQINKVIAICKRGPFLSEVRDVRVEFEDSDKYFDNFKIVR